MNRENTPKYVLHTCYIRRFCLFTSKVNGPDRSKHDIQCLCSSFRKNKNFLRLHSCVSTCRYVWRIVNMAYKDNLFS
uniref:Uncharacterized protein n=1 Tax=Octopus bimaculoides TaxID=37653 RepID=A0A0L8GHV5_OCTBM